MQEIIDFCQKIGKNSLLVQGAGGNISWKDDHALWIKASGAWLEEARADMFIPVDLADLSQAISEKNYHASLKLREKSVLKPSIETYFHALLPQKIVLHLHSIDILTHLVQRDINFALFNRLSHDLKWVLVDYFKPGAELAAAIHQKIKQDTNIIFLKNHGFIIAADTLFEIEQLFHTLCSFFKCSIFSEQNPIFPVDNHNGFRPISDPDLHQLALNSALFKRLAHDWALYPDHVVFLGEKANIYKNWNEFKHSLSSNDIEQELIFIENSGVFVTNNFGKAKLVQLRCYYDVLIRQFNSTQLKSLSKSQINELLNWDAERYRISIAK